jgi:hypothetical protein
MVLVFPDLIPDRSFISDAASKRSPALRELYLQRSRQRQVKELRDIWLNTPRSRQRKLEQLVHADRETITDWIIRDYEVATHEQTLIDFLSEERDKQLWQTIKWWEAKRKKLLRAKARTSEAQQK